MAKVQCCGKVQIFWEGHIIGHNLQHGFHIYLLCIKFKGKILCSGSMYSTVVSGCCPVGNTNWYHKNVYKNSRVATEYMHKLSSAINDSWWIEFLSGFKWTKSILSKFKILRLILDQILSCPWDIQFFNLKNCISRPNLLKSIDYFDKNFAKVP